MSPAARELVRAQLDATGTPEDAPARRLLSDIDARCESCNLEAIGGCVCVVTPMDPDDERSMRMSRAELHSWSGGAL